jgi:hypothetical protein
LAKEQDKEEKPQPIKARPLTSTEEVELKENSVRRVEGFLRALNTWQKDSVSTAIRR